MSDGRTRPLRLFVVAGEHSGDALGGRLMTALRSLCPQGVEFEGVGGPHMADAGLRSLFPMSDIAVMGPVAILKVLPRLVSRIRTTADAAIATRPDGVVIIDSPEFTHRVARRVRRGLPKVPILDYVSPSVWAWRPGRAPRMRGYVDEVLALLPFEPAAHARLGGPPCTYVGHPLVERMSWIAGLDPTPLVTRLALDTAAPVLVVLPGSRRSEVERLMAPFGATVERVAARFPDVQVLLPTVAAVAAPVREAVARWPGRVHIIEGEDDKFRAFKLARTALAASGTVTLELAVSGCPMVVSYKVDGIGILVRPWVNPPHFALANLVLGERAFPELMQEDCEPSKLADALCALVEDGPERDRQLAALARVPAVMSLHGEEPSMAAARRVVALTNMSSK